MNEPLEIRGAVATIDRRAVEHELHDVAILDAIRRARTREQIALRIVGMSHTDVTERIHHSLVGENAVGSHELFDDGVQLGHRSSRVRYFLRNRMDRCERAKLLATDQYLKTASPGWSRGAGVIRGG